MNIYLGQKIVEIARALKPNRATGQFFHVSCLVRRNRIVCIGWNNYNKSHPIRRFGKYENYKGFSDTYKASLHAEIATVIKMGEEDLSNYSMINVRIGNFNQVAISKCCPNCARVLRSLGLPIIYYTNQDGNFEEMLFN